MSRRRARARVGLVGAVAAAVALSCGCAAPVRLVRETDDGGVLRMPYNSNQWPTYYRDQAEALMRRKCPGGYHVDHEGAAGGDLAHQRGPAYESYFGYTGGSEAEQVYFITFHGQPQAGRAGGVSPPVTEQRGANAPHPPSAADEELPAPRALPSQPEK